MASLSFWFFCGGGGEEWWWFSFYSVFFGLLASGVPSVVVPGVFLFFLSVWTHFF